jgi:DNA-binding FrmR family transcriptional regulator
LLEKEIDYSKVLQALATCRGAMNGLMHQVLEGHILEQVVDKSRKPTREQSEATNELVETLKAYLK